MNLSVMWVHVQPLTTRNCGPFSHLYTALKVTISTFPSILYYIKGTKDKHVHFSSNFF